MKGKNSTRANERGEWERAKDEVEENGRGAERADRCLLRTTVKPSMPLAFDNYSRSRRRAKNERLCSRTCEHTFAAFRDTFLQTFANAS